MGTHPIFESDFDCLTDMNGLVAYGSDSEDETEVAAPTPPVAVKKPSISLPAERALAAPKSAPAQSQKTNSSWNSVGAGSLGGSILASEYQLKMLNKQRAKAAASGSKKRIFITAPSFDFETEEETVERPKKKKIQPSTTRSKLFSSLPKPKKDAQPAKIHAPSVSRSDAPSTSASTSEPVIQPVKPSGLVSTSSFMPNSVKNRPAPKTKPKKPAPAVVKQPAIVEEAEDSDSDDEGGFFSFSTKEKDAEELKKHAPDMPVGPMMPSFGEIDQFGAENAALPVHGSTRHPDEAIAPYGNDLSSFQTIAGRLPTSEEISAADAGLDIDQQAISKLQGRKRENIQFVDAVVDKSLGNIRENIRKSANQKHVSTSMVDPVKEMRKNDPNAHVSKRTHQLKYLVELAKANETRLNQLWSNAKSSSRTTAMKYGW